MSKCDDCGGVGFLLVRRIESEVFTPDVCHTCHGGQVQRQRRSDLRFMLLVLVISSITAVAALITLGVHP